MNNYERCQLTGDTMIHDRYVYLGQTGSGEIVIPLTGKQIKSICTIGNNDEAVKAVSKNKRVSEAMSHYSNEVMIKTLKEYGTWSDEELTDRVANILRLIWTQAWDIFESENPNEYLADN